MGAQESLERRVEMSEQRVTLLEQLPMRMTALESQFVQLRDEMRAEFSAIRAEGRAGNEETRRVLREEIRAGDEETRRYMRALHEEVIERIKVLSEPRPASPPRRGRR